MRGAAPCAILKDSKPFVVAGPKTGFRGTTGGFFFAQRRPLCYAGEP